MRRRFFFVALCTLFVSTPLLAGAASVSWTLQEGSLHSPDNSFGRLNASANVYGPVMNFEYRAYVRNAGTGAIITPGSTVAAGTELEFSFDAHQSSDISWVGSGGAYDSPYGEWRAGATAPTRQCHTDDFVMSGWSNTNGGFGYGNYSMYVNMTVNPPTQTVTGVSGLSCGAPASDGSVVCTASGSGSVPASFSFAETYGKFYPQIQSGSQCRAYNYPMSISETTWQYAYGTSLTIPAQTISYPILVAAVEEENSTPSTPTVSAQNGAACIIDSPYTLLFSSTDSDGDTLRYLIDWDNDGSADQVVPPSGYVSSGTTQSASRTFTIAGEKIVKVLAEDSNGATSAWRTHTFSCTEAADEGSGSTDGEGDGEGDGGSLPPEATLSIRAIPSIVRIGEQTTIRWEASAVSSCSVTGTNGDSLPAEGQTLPIPGEALSTAITGQTTYTLSCIESETGATETATATVNILPIFQEQ